MGNGLEASVWAPRPGAYYGPKPGDWDCVSCGISNFAWRTACFRCSTPKGEPMADHPPSAANWSSFKAEPRPGKRGDVEYQNGDNASLPNRLHSDTEADDFPVELLDTKKYGLATSRWAPKNYKRGMKELDEPQIWTRTVQIARSTPESNAVPASSPRAPDLGLPYEVQHFILATIQRILEEACYDFAARWIPHRLVEYNWTCAEAVELSTWRKMLPELLPRDALPSTQGTSLEKGLANAVRIRNAAVHRHLCDNIEIKQMAAQAQNLVAMFVDVTRETKLYHLQLELSEWDALSGKSWDAANGKLRTALQEISERPVNDMDWTPNSVSLEEVGHETVSDPPRLDGETQQNDLVDEMELD